MADIVLKGNTSGSITIASPDVAGVNVLTLPVETGTLLTTNTPLPEVTSVEFSGAGDSSGSIAIAAPYTNEINTLTFPETTGTFAVENSLGMRNLIINGNMMIDQRNLGESAIIIRNNQYTIDRFQGKMSEPSKYSVQQVMDGPPNFYNSLKVTSASAYTVLPPDFFDIEQRIEGVNCARLKWGTPEAQPVTLSVWVKSSLTGIFTASIRNGNADRSFPFSYVIESPDTWEYKAITIAGDTTGAWADNNSTGIRVNLSLGMGSDFTSEIDSAFTGEWQEGNYAGVSDRVNVVGTEGATLSITGLQLEAGDVATPFENLQYGQQLVLCERYCEVYNQNTSLGTGLSWNDTTASTSLLFRQKKRANPTITPNSMTTFAATNGDGVGKNSTNVSSIRAKRDSVEMQITVEEGLTVGQASLIRIGSGGLLTISAEL